MNLGPLEIGIVLVIVLIIFGPKRLPQLGRSLGSGMREFKDAVTGRHKDDEPDELEAGAGAGASESGSTGENVGRSVGSGVREFKDAVTGKDGAEKPASTPPEDAAGSSSDDAQRAKTADAS